MFSGASQFIKVVNKNIPVISNVAIKKLRPIRFLKPYRSASLAMAFLIGSIIHSSIHQINLTQIVIQTNSYPISFLKYIPSKDICCNISFDFLTASPIFSPDEVTAKTLPPFVTKVPSSFDFVPA